MRILDPAALEILRNPGTFVWRTLRAFRANQGLLLAGAVAYYALLSIVPLLILTVIALSRLIDQAELMETLGRYLEWIIPGQSTSIIRELSNFLVHQGSMGWLLLVTMIFFSSLAFTVLENAMSVIFYHRVAIRRRRFLISAVIPYCYILLLGGGLLLITVVSPSRETSLATVHADRSRPLAHHRPPRETASAAQAEMPVRRCRGRPAAPRC